MWNTWIMESNFCGIDIFGGNATLFAQGQNILFSRFLALEFQFTFSS